MSEITRKKFEEKKGISDETYYIHRGKKYVARKKLPPEDMERLAEETRKEEQRVKRELHKKQLEAARKILNVLYHINRDLDSANLKLFKVTDYVYIPIDKSAIMAIRREIETRRNMINALHARWYDIVSKLEREQS